MQYYHTRMGPCVITAILLAFAACRNEPAVTVITDTRAPIEVAYVGAPELQVHAKADDTSPVIITYLNGESVSLLARKGDWVEVKTAGASGWAHAADLTNADAARQEEKNPTPRFRTPPSPVVQPGAHGAIFIEANVNDQGEVTSTTVIVNETGNAALGAQNEAALRAARFYPIVQKGKRVRFIYDYRVTY
jgi:Bacterial SH3 domain/Gram-negative bacterial TonB protein C-terminal